MVSRTVSTIVVCRPWVALVALACHATLAALAAACPFCGTPQQTLSEELDTAQAAVFASLLEPMPDPADAPEDALPEEGFDSAAVFEVTEVVRGEEHVETGQKIKVVYFGQDDREKRFLITSLAGDRLDWSTPIPLSQEAQDYVRKLRDVPEQGADRLDFFQNYFEHEDRLLAQDAYDEFARAPYEEVIALGERIHRERLLKWIDDPQVGPSSRRLYLTLLGVCGQSEDIPMLERLLNFDRELIDPGVVTVAAAMQATGTSLGAGLVDELVRAEEQRKKQSLDALIACYLKLKGEAGLDLVNRLFLGNPHVEYTHLHSAIMALRFHGEEADVLPRSALLESMRLALDHPDFADQVVPDLARWEDWQVMPRLIEMFRTATSDSWIRQPVASYLLVAGQQPGEVGSEARAALEELEQLDPETVKRARTLSAFSLLTGGKPREAAADAEASGASNQADLATDEPAADEVAGSEASNRDNASTASTQPDAQPPAAEDVDPGAIAQAEAKQASEKDAAAAATAGQDSDPGEEAESTSVASTPLPRAFSRYTLLGVLLLAGLGLLAIFAVLIRGADPRLSRPPGETDADPHE